MRVWSQLAVLALLGGGVAGWHVYGEQFGLKPPMELLGLKKEAATTPSRSGQPAGGVGVVVAPVRVGPVVERVESVGTARAREAVTVTTRLSGIIAAINFQEGQRVAAGTVLVELDRSQLIAELEGARATLDDARQQLGRARQLRATQAVAEARIDQLEATQRSAEARVRQVQARIEEMKIVAPFDGRVGIRQVSLGALVPPGAVVTTLDDVSRMRVEFTVPEVYVAKLAQGMAVSAGSAAFGTRRFEGTVTVIDTRIDAVTRAVRVISEFPNDHETLRPGLFMNVVLTLATRSQALIVREDAIDPVGDQAFVYAVRQGRAVRQLVTLGARLAGEVEVTSGLTAEDVVVVRGLQRLRNGVPVRITETQRPAAS
jgi:membrane fusion protein, multidrug efflux system